jgi:hypothetical protein
MLIDDVCDAQLSEAAGRSVADVRIGLGYTGVALDNGRCGLAYTFRHATGGGCSALKEAGSLGQSTVSDLAQLAHSRNVLMAAIGLATLNALVPSLSTSAGDVLDLLSIGPEDTVGMVGFFGPLVEPIKKLAKSLQIVEQREDLGPLVLPQNAAQTELPQCQVVIVTGTALINRTIDGVLEHCRNAREVAILGPSTPLAPSVFASRGVTVLSGMQVVNSVQALRVISEGGGTPQLLNSMRKVSIRIG